MYGPLFNFPSNEIFVCIWDPEAAKDMYPKAMAAYGKVQEHYSRAPSEVMFDMRKKPVHKFQDYLIEPGAPGASGAAAAAGAAAPPAGRLTAKVCAERANAFCCKSFACHRWSRYHFSKRGEYAGASRHAGLYGACCFASRHAAAPVRYSGDERVRSLVRGPGRWETLESCCA